MSNKIKYDRYSVTKEFTGSKNIYVARFCGEFISSEETESGAWLSCIFHQDERENNILSI